MSQQPSTSLSTASEIRASPSVALQRTHFTPGEGAFCAIEKNTDNIAEPECDGLKLPESFYNHAEWLGLSAFSAIEDGTKTSETSLMSVLKSQFWCVHLVSNFFLPGLRFLGVPTMCLGFSRLLPFTKALVPVQTLASDFTAK